MVFIGINVGIVQGIGVNDLPCCKKRAVEWGIATNRRGIYKTNTCIGGPVRVCS
jgi:hypothetical protein